MERLGSKGGRGVHSLGNLLKSKWPLVFVNEFMWFSSKAGWDLLEIERKCSEMESDILKWSLFFSQLVMT